MHHCAQYCVQHPSLDVATRSQHFVQHYAEYLISGYHALMRWCFHHLIQNGVAWQKKALGDLALMLLRPWQTRTHCCGHIVAHDVSWAAQTGKHLLRTQNVSEQNQKHFLCPGHKICVRNKCCPCRQTGKHLCRQQCVRNNVSSFTRAFRWRGESSH